MKRPLLYLLPELLCFGAIAGGGLYLYLWLG